MVRGGRIWVYFALLPVLFSLLAASPASALMTGGCNVSLSSTSGVVLVDSGGYCYLVFSATGANSFTVPNNITSASVLVVAGGGGGGGGAWGGGGGAGGVVTSTSYPLTPGVNMNISVGAGGAGGGASLDPTLNRGANGSNSWINTSSSFVAIGGGFGAGYAYGSSTANIANGSAGGSGGGGTEHGNGGLGGASTQTLPTNATAKYGSAGGATAAGSGYVAGAGGGGAVGAGGAMTTSAIGGAGGAGTNAFSSWFTAIGQFGVSGYIAGGGGGGSSSTAGTGGSGGGGAGGGSTTRAGGNATANTGGGGGGASYSGGPVVGGAGGSGLIIFKFTSDGPANILTVSAISVYETTTAIAALSADESVTWAIVSGVDSLTVSLSGAALSFTSLRDFEAPTDSGTNNQYNFTIRATDSVGNTSNLAMTVTILDVPETTAISINAFLGNLYKGVSTSLTVTVNAPGKVRFFFDNKRIANCLAVATSGSYPNYSATCAWKPGSVNRHAISATFTPSGGTFSNASAAPKEAFILKRTTTR